MFLGIDTATLVSGVALADNEKVVAELIIQNKKTHSELLMPHLKQLFDMARVDKSVVSGIAVSIGPGSFTGLRIGLATAKTIAYAWKVPIVGVPTLAAQAYACPVPGVFLCSLLDAQKGNVYQALYEWDGYDLCEITAPRVVDCAELLAELKKLAKPVIMLGEGAQMFSGEIAQVGRPLYMAEPHVLISRASSVALRGRHMFMQGIKHDPMTLEPNYIRRSEAEVLWEKRRENG